MSTEIVKQPGNAVAQFNYFDSEQFATMQRLCTMFANSELVPEMYKVSEKNPKEKAIANCMIAVETAQRIGASPLMVMQNLTIIYGRPSWSSKFLVATVNTCGRFSTLKYTIRNLGKVGKTETVEHKWVDGRKTAVSIPFDGSEVDNLECIAYCTEKGSDEVLESTPVSIDMAIREGWYTKSGSKWRTMPLKMLKYRAASFWTNEYAPELSMGMKTVEESEDIEDIDYDDVTDVVMEKISKRANKMEMTMNDGPGSGDQSTPPANTPTAQPEQNPI